MAASPGTCEQSSDGTLHPSPRSESGVRCRRPVASSESAVSSPSACSSLEGMRGDDRQRGPTCPSGESCGRSAGGQRGRHARCAGWPPSRPSQPVQSHTNPGVQDNLGSTCDNGCVRRRSSSRGSRNLSLRATIIGETSSTLCGGFSWGESAVRLHAAAASTPIIGPLWSCNKRCCIS